MKDPTRFHFVADITFDAKDLDDAFKALSDKFLENMGDDNSTMEERGMRGQLALNKVGDDPK